MITEDEAGQSHEYSDQVAHRRHGFFIQTPEDCLVESRRRYRSLRDVEQLPVQLVHRQTGGRLYRVHPAHMLVERLAPLCEACMQCGCRRFGRFTHPRQTFLELLSHKTT